MTKTINIKERTVIQHGTSLVMTLPRIWLKNIDLTYKDKVSIKWDLETNDLIISKVV